MKGRGKVQGQGQAGAALVQVLSTLHYPPVCMGGGKGRERGKEWAQGQAQGSKMRTCSNCWQHEKRSASRVILVY